MLKSSRGEAYRLSLEAEKDIAGRVVVLELLLQKENNNEDDDSNLLDVTGRLHGYQPYFFAASDFVRGTQKSVYGETRTMDVPKLGMKVQVKVVRVAVEQAPADAAAPASYQFTDLTLQVITRSLPGRNSPK
ncbi:MAG: hypothetical protein ACLQMO_15010 [Acidobacteriaceae bacterium]